MSRSSRGPDTPTPQSPATDASGITRLRRLVLAIIFLGIVGLFAELSLLDHRDELTQWVPYGVLLIALASTIHIALRPSRRALRLFQSVMVLQIATAGLGLILHYRGNVEFEIERDESLRGVALFWEAIRGATPTLAPGALAQLGLLGLAFTYRHPALSRSANGPNVATDGRSKPSEDL